MLAELDAGGAASQAISGFIPRSGQRRLGAAVADAVEADDVLIAEAGTGVGKTFAYLVPALLAGRQVIISTGTRTLQDQLYHRDLPQARAVLQARMPQPVTFAQLKGRANYLCRYRLERALDEGLLPHEADAERLQRAAAWARQTDTGDLAEAPLEVEGLGARISATPEQCLGQQCPAYDGCFFYEARRRAHEAGLVVVNHHLLLADWAVKDSGYGAVLPETEVLVLDEAHQVPDTAARFFGESLTARGLRELARDVRTADRREAGDMPDLPPAVGALEASVARLRAALGTGEQRAAWEDRGANGADEAVEEVRAQILELERVLAYGAERGPELEACHRRAREAIERLGRFLSPQAEDEVRWYEARGQGFALQRTPLEVGSEFQRRLEREASATVLVSATLAVGSSFAAFRRRLGLPETAMVLQLPSPFDYQRQSLLYCPPSLPQPNEPGFDEGVIDHALPLIEATPGGVLFLFTSHRALQVAHGRLLDALDRPVLAQGEAPQARLLEAFAACGHSVLLGTASFWQGVDIRGAALSAVIIDRLPFAAPHDPVTAARQRAAEAAGGVAFRDILLPDAVLALKQGAGRLIRDEQDRGVLMIADPRLLQCGYGRLFRDSLPDMPLTQDLGDVEAFWEEPWTS